MVGTFQFLLYPLIRWVVAHCELSLGSVLCWYKFSFCLHIIFFWFHSVVAHESLKDSYFEFLSGNSCMSVSFCLDSRALFSSFNWAMLPYFFVCAFLFLLWFFFSLEKAVISPNAYRLIIQKIIPRQPAESLRASQTGLLLACLCIVSQIEGLTMLVFPFPSFP